MSNSSYYALQQFGAAFLGPAFNSYTRAVHQYCHKSPQVTPVCLAREGWSIHRLLSRTTDLFDSSLCDPLYLKVSRTILFKSLLGDEIVYNFSLKADFSGSLMDLMIKRFGLSFDEVYAHFSSEQFSTFVKLPEDKHVVEDILRNVSTKLRKLVMPTYKSLLSYFKSVGLADHGNRPLMLDLGYSGTIQKLITYIIKKDTDGLYFIASKSGQNSVGFNKANMQGVFFNDVSWGDGCLMLDRSLFFEGVMTAPHGQVADIREMHSGQFEFLYGRETNNQHQFQDLKVVIDGGIQAARESILNGVVYSSEEVSALYSVYASSLGALPQSVSHLFSVEDDFSGIGIVNAKEMFKI